MKLGKTYIFIFVFIQLLTFNIFAENVTFSSEQSISSVAGDNPQITSDATGRYVYAIWQESGSNDIKIFISSDFGATFTSAAGTFGTGVKPQIIPFLKFNY